MIKYDITKVKYGITKFSNTTAEDLLCTALLKILNPDVEIMRVDKLLGIGGEEDPERLIYGIGGGQFDGSKEPLPDCTFLALWFELAPAKFGEEVTTKFLTKYTLSETSILPKEWILGGPIIVESNYEECLKKAMEHIQELIYGIKK